MKQGLLSLDPQTRYAPPDQADVESFIRSFKGEVRGGGGGGAVIAPGSYVQFLVEPVRLPAKEADADAATDQSAATAFIGTTPDAAPEMAMASSSSIEVHRDFFGAISSRGIYIASDGGEDAITTKLDSSGSFVISSH